APVFELLCRAHVRGTIGVSVSRVGRWWGHARHDLRRAGQRSTEEIDIVGLARNRVVLVGEAKWTSKPLDVSILRDLAEYQIPALQQAGFTLGEPLRTVLYGRSGFTEGLARRAAADPHLDLVELARLLP
ncbi:MAG: DUF234 domain-containing protein, partial [Pseudonocardiaceae bacterium]